MHTSRSRSILAPIPMPFGVVTRYTQVARVSTCICITQQTQHNRPRAILIATDTKGNQPAAQPEQLDQHTASCTSTSELTKATFPPPETRCTVVVKQIPSRSKFRSP